MEIKKDIFISFIVSGKPSNEEEIRHLTEVNDVPPCCGRNWWYWKPNFRRTNIGYDLAWLCFLISYDNYNNRTKPSKGQQMNAQEQTKDI